jgi:hypothetical protein
MRKNACRDSMWLLGLPALAAAKAILAAAYCVDWG